MGVILLLDRLEGEGWDEGCWRERKVGYDVWQSVVRAFVSCAADEERVVGSDSREES